jgi:general nucleoside transport system ATP-binding protein
MENELVLEAHGITKKFPGVLANDHVDLELRRGEILALLGENGAGKTTLMNILYGLYHADQGEIRVKGELLKFNSPNDAILRGIGMVHQHFMLIPVFTVAENIMLGSEVLRAGLVLDQNKVSQQIRELSGQYGLDVNPGAFVKDLSVGSQQRVEIVKALYRKAEILILDEPTAVLTPQEADDLFRIMRQLTQKGVSIIFITHKLKEIMAVADRVTVMRGGKVVGSALPKEVNEQKLADMMVGREVILTVDKKPAQPEGEVLVVKEVSVQDNRGVTRVNNVSFNVCSGEIMGIAGVQGNGQTELAEAITGLRVPKSGTVTLADQDVTGKPPRHLIKLGNGHIPEDRQRHGLVLPFPVADNLILCTYYAPPFSSRGGGQVKPSNLYEVIASWLVKILLFAISLGSKIIQTKVVDEYARRLIVKFDIRTPSPYVSTSTLSGGNQQKVIVARELSRELKLLVANQPTRGLDVGSIEFIHNQIIQLRDKGAGVLLVSAELDEILSLSDRIAVMYHGEIVAILSAADATREKLGLLMAGIKAEGT